MGAPLLDTFSCPLSFKCPYHGCSLEGLMLKLKLPILWPHHVKCWLIGKDPIAGKDWEQEEKGDDRGWDGWMASPTRRTWVWVNSRSWWWTGRPDVLRFMGSQRVGHDWATELNWTQLTDHRYFTVLPSGLLPTRFSLILKSGILEAHFSVIYFFYRQAIRAVKKAKLEKGSCLSTYSCIFGCRRSSLLHEGFSNCSKWGLLSSCSTWAFHFGGSVSCRARAPGMRALQLWHMGLVAPRQVGSFQILDPTPVFLALQGGFFIPRPPEKPCP